MHNYFNTIIIKFAEEKFLRILILRAPVPYYYLWLVRIFRRIIFYSSTCGGGGMSDWTKLVLCARVNNNDDNNSNDNSPGRVKNDDEQLCVFARPVYNGQLRDRKNCPSDRSPQQTDRTVDRMVAIQRTKLKRPEKMYTTIIAKRYGINTKLHSYYLSNA